MANKYTVMSEDSIKYVLGLIRDLASVSEAINNTNLADDKVFSNLYTKKLIDKCLEDANNEAQKLVGALTHLTCEETNVQPTLDNSTVNVIYLFSADGNAPYQQYLKISDTKLVDLGSTSISLTDYITAIEIARDYTTKVEFNTLVDKVDAIEDEIGTETLTTTSTTIKGAINEISDKSAIITVTKSEYEALTPKDPETYYITTDDMTMYKGESQVLGGKPLIGKETVLYEGNITAAGTYTLTDNVNNYDFIIINHRQTSGVNCQSITLSKYEISKCSDYGHKFMCVLGYGGSEDCVSGYFNNDKVIISGYANENITSITGYKFGQVTVQNTITNPSPAASYSTDEHLTGGTWIDGKPIYRKVFDYSNSLWGSGDKDISNLNIKQIISSYFIGANNADGTGNQWAQGVIGNGERLLYFNEKFTIMYRKGGMYYKYVILEYTKTTDS